MIAYINGTTQVQFTLELKDRRQSGLQLRESGRVYTWI